MHAVEHREIVRKTDVSRTMGVGNEIKSSMNH